MRRRAALPDTNGRFPPIRPPIPTKTRLSPPLQNLVSVHTGLNAITRVAALEFAKEDVRINAVLPGPVDSTIVNQVEALTPGYKAMIAARVPMERMGSAEEIAQAICWLCSDEASYVTGASFPVDGGMIEQ